MDNNWFFDDQSRLVCLKDNGGEVRFTIYDMRRNAGKSFRGKRSDWWSFNNARIILDEAMFHWHYSGLRASMQPKALECSRNPSVAMSTVLLFFSFLP
jgi:hypothetical protein